MADDFGAGSKAIFPLFEWLERIETISSEQKETFQHQKPQHFFVMLRTGYLLSRIAMIAVPTSADIYRSDINTDAVTSIERQANIKIFLSACKELKARTNLKTEVIERMEVGDWMEMLQTLQSLSRKMYDKLKDTSANFDPFTLKGGHVKKMIEIAKVPSNDDSDEQTEEYSVYGSPYRDPNSDAKRVSAMLGNTMSAMYKEYIMDEGSDDKLTGLRGALNELCNNETKYMERFIKILKKLSKQDIAPALKQLLVGLYEDHAYFIERLHDDLIEKIKPLADEYIKEEECQRTSTSKEGLDNVADVFVDMKEMFLMYAPFIVYCDNVERMISLMKIDASVKNSIKNLEEFLKDEMERTGNFNIPSSFNSLLAFPFQHVVRYKLMMNTIGKQISKKIQNDITKSKRKRQGMKTSQFQKDLKFLRDCELAVRALHELNMYINAYKRDSDYKASVRKICEQIRNMRSTDGLESDYGQLMFEGRMKFKRENEPKFTDNCYLMCFHSRILIFEIEEPEDTGKGLFGLKREESYQSTQKDLYVYIGSSRVTKNMVLLEDKNGGKKGEAIITIRVMDGFQLNNQESFSVMVPEGKPYDELKKKFQELVDKAVERPTTDKHRMHEFHTAIPKHNIEMKNPKPPPRCEECGLYIFGLLFMGYKCETCNTCYHSNCFLDGEADPRFRDEDIEWIEYISKCDTIVDNMEIETDSNPESDYDEVDEELKFGTEEDVTELKKRGKPGDYIIYHKEDDTAHPMRIAFLKTGGKGVVQKLKVKKSSKGFAFQSSTPTWYNSMSDLAQHTTDENSKRLLHPFLGKVSPQAKADDSDSVNDDGDGIYVLNPQDNIAVEEKEIEKRTVETKLQTSSRKLLTPIQSVDSDTSESEPSKELTKTDTHQNDLDILGNKAPTNLGIRYNLDKKDIQKQLKGHPEGTYIIHQSREKNEITKPYTIYANKTSEKDGQVRLAPAYIVYNETTGQFSVLSGGQKGKKYSTLQALITGHKKLLRSQLT